MQNLNEFTQDGLTNTINDHKHTNSVFKTENFRMHKKECRSGSNPRKKLS